MSFYLSHHLLKCKDQYHPLNCLYCPCEASFSVWILWSLKNKWQGGLWSLICFAARDSGIKTEQYKCILCGSLQKNHSIIFWKNRVREGRLGISWEKTTLNEKGEAMGNENMKIIQLSEYFCSCERPMRKGIYQNQSRTQLMQLSRSSSIYYFPLVKYSCLLSAGVLHALLCLKVYSWYIRGERCIRNTPSDTEVHAEHQLRADRSTWPEENNICCCSC